MHTFNFTRKCLLLIAALSISLFCLNCHTSKNHDHNNPENQDNNDGKEEPMDDGHKLGEVLKITSSERVAIGSENLKLKLESVGESRCPLNVQCFQIGKAKTKFQVIKDDMIFFVELSALGGCQKTDGSCGDSSTMHGYKFTLMSLTPYPGEDGKTSIQQENYVASVKVEKGK